MGPAARTKTEPPSARPGPAATDGLRATPGRSGPQRPRELTTEECAEHLAAASMGRISWANGGIPQIYPVSYAVHAGQVVFRTSRYGALRDLSDRTNVAFEIDQVDAMSGTGWSVVVRGVAEGVVLPQELLALWARPDIVPWAPGTRNLFVAITTQSISGRLVHAPFAG